MVNPAIFPVQRRGPAGPHAGAGGGSALFEPFDNERYLDPDYVDSGENGSIAAPFLSWADVIADVVDGDNSARIMLPGYPVTPSAVVIFTGKDLSFVGVAPSLQGSYINDYINLSSDGTTNQTISFSNTYLEGMTLDGGAQTLQFFNCFVKEIVESGEDSYEGEIYGFDTGFLLSQNTPDSVVTISNGWIREWEAFQFHLKGCIVGSPDLSAAGELRVHDNVSYASTVTFAAGTEVTFEDDPGTLYLDAWSYKSWIDGSCVVFNGTIVIVSDPIPNYPAEFNAGNKTGAASLSLATSLAARFTLTGNTVLTLTGLVAGRAAWPQLKVIQGGAGSYTLAISTAKTPNNGAGLALSTGVGDVDIVSCYWDGTNLYCSVAGLDFA